MIPYWKNRDLGRHHRRVQGLNQLVNIQLPSVEDVEGFLLNIRIKNVSVIEHFKNTSKVKTEVVPDIHKHHQILVQKLHFHQ